MALLYQTGPNFASANGGESVNTLVHYHKHLPLVLCEALHTVKGTGTVYVALECYVTRLVPGPPDALGNDLY